MGIRSRCCRLEQPRRRRHHRRALLRRPSRLHHHRRCTLRRHRRPRPTHNLGSLQPPNLNRRRRPRSRSPKCLSRLSCPSPPSTPLRRCRHPRPQSRRRCTRRWLDRSPHLRGSIAGRSGNRARHNSNANLAVGEPLHTGIRRRPKPSSVRASAHTMQVGRCPHCAWARPRRATWLHGVSLPLRYPRRGRRTKSTNAPCGHSRCC
jgi:hypothetical protein